MKISVIIPTFNEQDVILDCLKSLSHQTIQDFEVILVDDGSTDDTVKLIKKFRSPKFGVKLYRQNHLGAGVARNLGAKHARGEIFVFVDSDMTFDKKFLQDLTSPIVKGKTKGTFSKNEYVSNWDNIWAQCWNINEGWEAKKRHPKNISDKQKVFRAILRSEFDRVGGFTSGGYTDDYSLADKLRYEADAVSGALFYHKNPSSLGEIFKHAQWVSKRKYKLGIIGKLGSLFRASFIISFLFGIFKTIKHKKPVFIIFKQVYDAGYFVGLMSYLIFGKGSK